MRNTANAVAANALDERGPRRDDRPVPNEQGREAFESVLKEAAKVCAVDLQVYGDAVRTHRIVESRNLRFPFTLALANAARAGLALLVEEEQPHTLSREQFDGAGSIDLRCRVEESVFDIELKAGEGSRALYQCAWDALKVATLVSSGSCVAAYLVASIPSADLGKARAHPSSGMELFADGTHQAANIRERYQTSFRGYENERESRPGPRVVPSTFRTSMVASERIVFAHAEELGFERHAEWLLLVSRVEASGEAFKWESLSA